MGKKKRIKKKVEAFKATGAAGEENIKKPHHVPMDVYIQEAKNLYQWAGEDKEGLIAAGLNPGIIEGLPNRWEALSQAEALWYVEKNTRKNATKKYATLSTQAYNLKNRVLEDFTFGFRKHPALLKAARAIKKTRRKVDLVQGLNRLRILGKKNMGILSAIGFDMSLLEQAVQTASELSTAIAEAGNSILKYRNSKKKRDQAYTHLKEAIDEIRACGRFVFRHNKERARGYTSNHMRMQNARKTLKAKKAAANAAKNAATSENQAAPQSATTA